MVITNAFLSKKPSESDQLDQVYRGIINVLISVRYFEKKFTIAFDWSNRLHPLKSIMMNLCKIRFSMMMRSIIRTMFLVFSLPMPNFSL